MKLVRKVPAPVSRSDRMGEPTLRQIGGYQLVGTIGKGGMGVVYRALDNIGRTVAIKMLHGAYAEDRDLLKRFYREAQSTGSLQHKNIVTVHALGDHDGTPYLVMEFLDGRNLAELMADRVQMSLVEKLGIIIQVCDGLNYAHQRDLIHRDIKPANIIVLKDGLVKIVDFGIVRVGVGESLTHTGQLIGSMYYMSPEQINGAHIDSRSDLFSTGVMLYQLLTGVRPFEGADAAATFMKITLDPVPPLSRYLAELPTGLEEVVSKSLAKNPEERYQSAEELAFDLCHIQDTLKSGMSEEFLKRAMDAIGREEWELAKSNLQEILKLDRQHSRAYELLREVRLSIQNQQRSGQIRQLRAQAEVAVAGRQFEEALACVDAALHMAPEDRELIELRQQIEQSISKTKALRESLQRGEAALYAGDLDEAESAIQVALEVDANNTDARALAKVLEKELAERSSRAKVREYINEARQQISNQDFTSALNLLEQARTLDPSDSNVRELHNWALRGHEQELRRKEIEEITHEIREAIRKEDFPAALDLCDFALIRFPDEPSLLNVKEVAENRQKIKQRRLFIEQQSILARRHVDEGNYEAAIRGLQAALQQYPGEPNLEALLAVSRVEYDRRREEQEADDQRRAELRSAQAPSVDPKARQVADSVGLLRRALDSGEPANNLLPMAKSLRDIAAELDIEGQLGFDCNSVLLEFENRLKRWDRDSKEIDKLLISVKTAGSLSEMVALAERAHFLAEHHANDDHFKTVYSQISQFVKDTRSRRDAAVTRASTLLASMSSADDLASLVNLQKEIQEMGSHWPAELRISSLIEQAFAQVHEAREAKARILAELGEIEASFGSTSSRSHISIQLQHARRIAAECVQDNEITEKLETIRRIGEESLLRLNSICSEMKNILSGVSTATSLEDIEHQCAEARELSSHNLGVEEIDDLLDKVIRRADERRKNYKRMVDHLASLLPRIEKAEDRAELDLLRRQCQDLVKDWPKDLAANLNLEQAQAKIKNREGELLKLASADALKEQGEGAREAAQHLGSETILFPAADLADLKDTPTQPPNRRDKSVIRGGILGKLTPHYTSLLCGFVVLAALSPIALWFIPKTIYLHIIPADQSIVVDGKECSAPCVRKLAPGRHQVEARRPGFEDLRQTIRVPLLSAHVPAFTLKEAPAVVKSKPETPVPATIVPSETPKDLHPAKLSIRASTPGASVYVDGRLAGHTAGNGQLTVDTFDGPHEVRVEKQGFQSTAPKSVNIGPKVSLVVVPFKLDANPAAGAPADAKAIPAIIPPAPNPPSNASLEPAVVPPHPAPAPAPVARLTSTPDKISEGQAVTLAWQTENANDVVIDGIGAVGNSGSRQFSPERSTTYHLIAKGPGGTVAESVRVDVIPPNKPVPPISSDTEHQAIKSALQRYKDAYESESVDDMRRAWPGMTKAQEKTLKGTFNQFNAIRMSLHCQDEDIHISGDDASANCRQVSTYTQRGKKQPETTEHVRISLRKHDGNWAVSSVQ